MSTTSVPTTNNVTKERLSLPDIQSCRFVLPNKGNETNSKQSNVPYSFSDEQLNGMKRLVANDANVYAYATAKNQLLQHLFVVNLLHDYGLLTYAKSVIKYVKNDVEGSNDSSCSNGGDGFFTACNEIDIYNTVKKMLKNKASKVVELQSKRLMFSMKENTEKQTITDDNQHQNRWLWSMNAYIPYKRSTYHFSEYVKNNPLLPLKQLYPGVKESPINKGTYSIIHQFFNNTDIVLYNYSHLIIADDPKHVPLLHTCSRVRIRLEANCLTSFFIIFNSTLVHCGSESIVGNANEYYANPNPRMFSYVTRDGSALNKAKNVTNTIDKHSFSFCDVDNCKVCQNIIQKGKFKNNELVLNAYDEYACRLCMKKADEKSSRKSSSHHSRYLVFGDLEKMGWAVYRGIQFSPSNRKECMFIQSNLRDIISYKHTQKWKSIQPGRKYIKVVSLEKNIASRKPDYSSVGDLISMHDKLELRLRNEIKGFENCKLYDSTVIINDGPCPLQFPHRDIGSDEIVTEEEAIHQEQTKNSSNKRQRSSARVPKKVDRFSFV